MKKQTVIAHFGSVRAVAKALDISVQSIYEWPEEVPYGRQFELEIMTKGKLKASRKKTAASA